MFPPYVQQQVGQGEFVMGQLGGNKGGYGVQGTCGPAPAWQQQQKPKLTPGGSHSNTRKMNNKIIYCYLCGYYVDHNI